MAITTEDRENIITLVVGMFDAAPGSKYLSSLVTAKESGMTISAMAEFLTTLPQFNEVYPSLQTVEEFADAMVANLLPDTTPAGAVTWSTNWIVTQLNAGATKAEVFVAALAELRATTNENYADAQATLANKVEVATYYSVDAKQSSTDVGELQAVVAEVTSDDATVEDAKDDIDDMSGSNGTTFTLAPGPDDLVGTSSNDTFNALNVDSNNADKTTFSAFDSLNGGAGKDTLNIYTTETVNTGFVASTTVENIEVVNIYNELGSAADFGKASNFVGVEQLWQHVDAVKVTELAATTTAGFKNIKAPGGMGITAVDAQLQVEAAASAASASIALSSVEENVTLKVSGAALNSVTISGTVVDTAAAADLIVGALDVTVEAGATQQTATLNTAVATDLTLAGAKLNSLDASGSTGGLTFTGEDTIGSIKSGTGNDTLGIITKTTGTLAAVLESGAGNDKLTVTTTGTGTTTVTAGEGKDTVTVTDRSDGVLTVNGGAGDDTVSIATGLGIDTIKTTDVLNGGEGTDTIGLLGKVFDAEDYIILNEVVTSFETLELTGDAATVDASKLAGYTSFELEGALSTITEVGADQTLTVTTGVTASSAGYKVGTLPALTVYGGDLDITAVGAGTVTANANAVNLTVSDPTNNDGTPDTTLVTLVGDAKSANVTLVTNTDTKFTPETTDDVLDTSMLLFANSSTVNAKLTTLTISGNGMATVINVDETSLVTVDASGLASVDIDGKASAGLTYITSNTASETITLGSGLDMLQITGSTYEHSDTVTGLTLVDDAAVAGTQLDTDKSDKLTVNDGGGQLVDFVKATSDAATLNFALIDLAASDDDNVVFQYGGDTYIYADVGADSVDILGDNDVLIKLTGTVNLDLLTEALNTAIV